LTADTSEDAVAVVDATADKGVHQCLLVRRICEEYQPNCSNWVKSIKLGRILV